MAEVGAGGKAIQLMIEIRQCIFIKLQRKIIKITAITFAIAVLFTLYYYLRLLLFLNW
jgi:hypothetical protein